MKADVFPCTHISNMVDNSIDHGGRFFKPISCDSSSSRSSGLSCNLIKSSPSEDKVWSGLDLFNGNLDSATLTGSLDTLKKGEEFANYGFSYCSATPVPLNCSSDNFGNKNCSANYTTRLSNIGSDAKSLELTKSLITSNSSIDCNLLEGMSPISSSRTGLRAIRASNLNINQPPCLKSFASSDVSSRIDNSIAFNRSINSTSPARDSRSCSPSESDSSGLGLSSEASVSSWISNLTLGTSVSGPCQSSTKAFIPNSFRSTLPEQPCMPLMTTPFLSDKRWQFCAPYDFYDDFFKRAVKRHRTAAHFSEASCTWSGTFHSSEIKNPTYSTKVFLGGVPYDINEAGLKEYFSKFGAIEVKWPDEDSDCGKKKKGYAYIILESEKSVKALLSSCEIRGEKQYVKLPSRRMPDKDVQVIPWARSNSHYTRDHSSRVETNKMVFVGNLHGMMTAEHLATIMNDLFGGVIYVGIDIDKHQYPIGSSRVAFNNIKSYKKALEAAFIDAKCGRVTKRVSYIYNYML